MFVKLCLNLAKFGQKFVKFGQIWSNLGHGRPGKFGKNWKKFENVVKNVRQKPKKGAGKKWKNFKKWPFSNGWCGSTDGAMKKTPAFL